MLSSDALMASPFLVAPTPLAIAPPTPPDVVRDALLEVDLEEVIPDDEPAVDVVVTAELRTGPVLVFPATMVGTLVLFPFTVTRPLVPTTRVFPAITVLSPGRKVTPLTAMLPPESGKIVSPSKHYR